MRITNFTSLVYTTFVYIYKVTVIHRTVGPSSREIWVIKRDSTSITSHDFFQKCFLMSYYICVIKIFKYRVNKESCLPTKNRALVADEKAENGRFLATTNARGPPPSSLQTAISCKQVIYDFMLQK